MQLSPFHAYYKARTLAGLSHGKDKLAAVYASSDIEIYPYQIAASYFALRSEYLRGCILCDDASLGKSFEAMLIIAQSWYEGKQKILIVVPTPLLHQWTKIIDSRFSVPLFSIDGNFAFNEQIHSGNANPFMQDGVVITTYDFAAEKAAHIAQIAWDMTVFEEAHRLRRTHTGENKGAAAIREAVVGSYKLLLTATPMQSDIMDLYGLIYFIDENALPEADVFYKRYFRKPENYAELANRVSKYCFRTTRPQVASYVKIPERIPITIDCTPTDKEQRLADMLKVYLAMDKKYAFPKMDLYDLTLMLYRNLSSSTFALEKTLEGVKRRLLQMLEADTDPKLREEYALIKDMLSLCGSINETAKGTELLAILKTAFSELKRLGANKKALVFTENRATQKYLHELLSKNGYKGKVLTYSGDTSRDYTIMDRFEEESTILIATDTAAEGFNLEFCSLLINFDLPYNALKIEQRISRCHRQGQQSDAIIVNFLSRGNFADVRLLELINKRVLQFDGIIGLTDDVIGNFGADIKDAMQAARTKDEIERTFAETLETYADENKQLVKTAEQSLFTSFSRDIAENVTVTPQYMQQRIREINDNLWALTTYFFQGKQGYSCEDETRTLRIGIQPQKVFTGSHLGRREYSMMDKSLPASGRHTLTGTLARNMLAELFWRGIPDTGTVVVDNAELRMQNAEPPCQIGYYRVKVKRQNDYIGGRYYNVFVGQAASGQILSEEECHRIMELPVLHFTADGETYGERDGISKPKRADEFDNYINPNTYIERTILETQSAEKEEIENMKSCALDQKMSLDRKQDELRSEIRVAELEYEKANHRLEKLDKQKHLNALQKELKAAEQSVLFDSMKIDVECEKQVKEFISAAKMTAEVTRQFVIKVEGN